MVIRVIRVLVLTVLILDWKLEQQHPGTETKMAL